MKYDDWSALNLHVAMDNNIIIKEIGKLIPALLKEISNYLPLWCDCVRMCVGKGEGGFYFSKIPNFKRKF